MNLSRSKILAVESRIVNVGWNISIEHSYPGGALEKVFSGEVPATKVKEELDLMLASGRADYMAVRLQIEEFLEYVTLQVDIEKLKKLMKKAALAAKKAGIRYDRAQLMFCDALEEVGAHEVDDSLGIMGWRRDIR